MSSFGGISGIFRLDSVLAMMDESVRESILDRLKEVESEIQIQLHANKQLETELQADIVRERKNGVETSALYQKLPPEIRHQIYSYVVQTEHSIHVFPPKGNESHGYRLSMCEEATYNWTHGHCQCENGRNIRPSIQSSFFDNAIFLVSRTVRREALDAFFAVNHFTFTCLYEFVRFSSTFKQSVSKIQSLRLLEKVDDYPASEHKIKNIQKTRERLRNLRHLDLHLYVSTWSAYENLHEDGLINELIHFAFGPPLPSSPLDQTCNKQKHSCEDYKDANSACTSALNAVTAAHAAVTNSTTLADAAIAAVQATNLTLSTMSFPPPPSLRTLPGFLRKRLLPEYPVPQPDVVPARHPDPIQPLKSFSVTARPRGYRILPSETDDFAELGSRLEEKLVDVFMNTHRSWVQGDGTTTKAKYSRVEDVPPLQPEAPRLKVRDDERPLESRRGILFLKD